MIDKLRRTMTASKRELHDEAGATLVEYGILIALIAGGGLAVVSLLGPSLLNAFQQVNNLP